MSRTRHLKTGAPLVLALMACARLAHAQGTDLASAAETREINLRAYVELLRSDLRAQKVAVITAVMQLTDAEDAAFWPVHRQYEAELATINDDRMALIREYARAYETLTDPAADSLAQLTLDVDAMRHALTARYYRRFKAIIPPKTAARFLQVEHQLLLLLDLQIAASLPIVSR